MVSLAAKGDWRNRALWDFATRLYACPGVAPTCLALQDRFGTDIPLLLAAIWHGESGRGALGVRQFAAWKACARRWRTGAITPLRAARNAIREAAKADPAVARLRQKILAAELAAEKLLLRDLEALAAALASRAHATHRRTRRADALANARLAVRDPQARAMLTKIFSAIGPSS